MLEQQIYDNQIEMMEKDEEIKQLKENNPQLLASSTLVLILVFTCHITFLTLF
jgi:hypothetical protein